MYQDIGNAKVMKRAKKAMSLQSNNFIIVDKYAFND